MLQVGCYCKHIFIHAAESFPVQSVVYSCALPKKHNGTKNTEGV